MKAYVRIIIAVSFLALITGCDNIGIKMPAKAENGQGRKFAEPNGQAPTAVQSAIIMSDKYAKLSEEMSAEKARNLLLTDQNAKLQEQVTTYKQQLDQTQKELTEANSLLIDMRKELNNWKADVLGYRDEMRAAHKAQLETLLRIVNLLGGESTPTPAAAAPVDVNTPAAQPKAAEPNK